jgi:hypothetical protein
MCNKHYLRWIRSTPPEERPSTERPVLDRFFALVNKTGPLARNDPSLGRCWVWTGGGTVGGGSRTGADHYGIFWANGTSHRAHVFAYKTLVGPVPDGLDLDHFACDRTLCVNPAHLRPVPKRVNILRSTGPAAINAEKTHCPQNHPYDEANTRINSQGRRVCIECARKRDRETKKAKRDAAKAAAQ